MMNTTAERAQYNAGLERGRKHQERGGYLVPAGVFRLPSAEARAYEAGWQKGYETTTRLDLLRA